VHLVGELLVTWNTLEPSILLMYDKLVKLGFRLSNGQVVIVEVERGQKRA